jgi:scyllo-inositol 2-dehydrogenase (NADP+)
MSKKNKPIGVGMVGLGRAGNGMHRRELDARPKKFKVVAGCDVIKDRCEVLSEAYDCPTYSVYEDMLKNPEVELVDIATPSPEHVSMAIKALKAGKKVFLEKPIALTFKEAKKLERATKHQSDDLYIRHNRRFEEGFQHIKEIIAEGLLGDVYEIKLRRHNYQRRADWQTIIDCGGGQLLNWGPHIVDHALQFLGGKVDSVWSDLRKIAALGDAEDHVHIILKGGARKSCVVDLEISGGISIGEPTYLVYGSKGSLVEKGNQLTLKYLDPKQKLSRARASKKTPGTGSGFGAAEKLKWIEKTIPINPKKKVGCDQIWDHLHASIRNNKPFPITLAEALQVMEVISQARKGSSFQI